MATDRRQFLQGLLALGASTALPARAAQPGLPRVRVSAQRVIRTLVGLRPYRAEGFVLRAERLGDQLLIHNYGHGGAGITLSWGCAQLAADLMTGMEPQQVAVVGAGVIGLTTARELQRRGWSVNLYAKALPPQTTSNIAGGFWYPVSVAERERTTPAYRQQFHRACELAHRRFQEQVGSDHGVRWIQTLDMRNEPVQLRNLPGGSRLYPENQLLADARRRFGFPLVRSFQTMMIEPHQFLATLLRDFHGAGGRLRIREFQAPEELASLGENVVVNCTGLGSAKLFNDSGLRPARGQLEVLLPQAEITYCYTSPAGYMFPRSDGIVLGGSFELDNWSLEPDLALGQRILDGNARVARGFAPPSRENG